MDKIRLLVLGTGSQARNHAKAFQDIPEVEMVAAVDHLASLRDQFCADFAVPTGFETLDEALGWGEFDAAVNVTPDAVHYPTTMALLRAGKHVLCEKPLSVERQSAREMADLAKALGLVNVVNLSYRDLSVLHRAAEMVAAGEIGDLRHAEASYLQSWLTQPAWGDWQTESRWLWRLSTKHGSKGVLGDVGIHILDFLTFAAGAGVEQLSCRLKTFPKAEGNRIGDYVLDANDAFVLHLELTGGAVGTVSATRMASGHHNDLRLRLYGTKGGLDVRLEAGQSSLHACLGEDRLVPIWREVETEKVPNTYRRFVDLILGQTGFTVPDFARGADLQDWLDLAVLSDARQGCSLTPADLAEA